MDLHRALVAFCHTVSELLDRSGLYEVYRAATKTSACHARSHHPPLTGCDVDHDVELAAAHFVFILKAKVRLRHPASRRSQVVLLQGIESPQDALVLADDVKAAPIDQLGQICA